MLPSLTRLALRQADTSVVLKYVDDARLNADAHERGVEKVHGSYCVICLGSFKAGEEVEVFSCGHTSHLNCARNWYGQGKQPKCFVCRQPLTQADRSEVFPADLQPTAANQQPGRLLVANTYLAAVSWRNWRRNDDNDLHPSYYDAYVKIRDILMNDINPNLVNGRGWSALAIACKYGMLDIMRLLLEHPRIDVNLAMNDPGSSPHAFTALSQACTSNNIDVVHLLLDSPNILVDGDLDWTPLMSAVEHGDEGIVRLLLQKGAEVNKTYGVSRSPLMISVLNGDVGMARLLLDNPQTDAVETRINQEYDRILYHRTSPDREQAFYDEPLLILRFVDRDVDFADFRAQLVARRRQIENLIREAARNASS